MFLANVGPDKSEAAGDDEAGAELGTLIDKIGSVGGTDGPASGEAGVRLDNSAVGKEVTSAADQMTRIIILACILGIRKRIGYMMAKYLSILMATIV